jgi:filamin
VDNGDGTCTVSYIPTAPGEYNITVKFADSHISGSPFTAKISRKFVFLVTLMLP